MTATDKQLRRFRSWRRAAHAAILCLLLLAALLLAVASSMASPADSYNVVWTASFREFSTLGRPALDQRDSFHTTVYVDIVDEYGAGLGVAQIYVGQWELHLLNIISLEGEVQPNPGILFVDGNTLYSAWQTPEFKLKLVVIDITEPSSPRLLGEYNWPWGLIESFAIVPGELALIDIYGSSGGLHIVDLTSLANGAYSGIWYEPDTAFHGVVVAGHTAYVGRPDGLLLLDLSNPQSPSPIRTINASDARPLYAAGGYVHVNATIDGVEAIHVFDAADADLTPLVGQYAPGRHLDLVVDGDLAFVQPEVGHDINVFDISDLSDISPVGAFDSLEPLSPGLAAAGRRILATTDTLHPEMYSLQYTGPLPQPPPSPGAAQPLVVQAEGPGIRVNSQPLPEGSSQEVQAGDLIEFVTDKGKILVSKQCADDLIYFLAEVFPIEFNQAAAAAILMADPSLCDSITPLGKAQPAAATDGTLAFALQSGGTRQVTTYEALSLAIQTSAATVRADGVNDFAVSHDPDSGVTTATSYLGAATVDPANPALSDVVLHAGQQAAVSQESVGPVTAANGPIYLPLILHGAHRAAPPPPAGDDWVTVVEERFEGAFPGDWELFDNSNGDLTWGRRQCQVFAGGFSGWAIGGGHDNLACGRPYPHDIASWMVYGPFSLADAQAAELNFKLWINSETDYDRLLYLASTNGTDFYGRGTSGNSQGWIDRSLDLADVPTLGNLLGKSQVWLAFGFESDSSINAPEGAHIDNVAVRQCVGANCPASHSAATSGLAASVQESAVVRRLEPRPARD